jgi:hypothetical protein
MRLASSAIGIQAAVCAGGALVGLRLGAAGRRAHPVPPVVHVGANDSSAWGDHGRDADAAATLAALAYELLDAHADTAQLADGLAYDLSWAAHLDYLRALQRKGREMLARNAPDELTSCRSADSESLDVC